MQLIPEIVRDEQSFEAFSTLLQSSLLPHSDLDYTKHLLVGYYYNHDLVGTGGLEFYGDYALLRSLAVKIDARGLSLGSFITKDLIAKAQLKNVKGIYLLTETAQNFFKLKGFKIISRDVVPDVIKKSSEFSHVCPSSAICMFRPL